MAMIRTLLSKTVHFGLLPGLRRGFTWQVLREFRRRREAQWMSADEVTARQTEKLRALVRHAARNVPYYRRLHRAGRFPDQINSPADLSCVPALTKDQVRADPRDFMDEAADPQSMVPRWTGGSSGDTLQFHVSPSSLVHISASEMWGNSLAGYRPGDPMAMLWGAHFDAPPAAGTRQALARYLLNRETFVTNVMTQQCLRDIAEGLRRFRPAVLVGYVSSLVEFARYAKDTRDGAPTSGLRGVVATAEPLSDPDRALLQDVYSCPVHDRYGSRESGLIGMQCSRLEGLHVDCENVHLDLEPCPEAGPGVRRILVTRLNEFGMPFIRYDQGDYTTRPLGRCSCGRGFPVLAGVDGRRLSIVRRQDGTAVPGEIFIALFGVQPVRKYQVVQNADHGIEVELVPAPAYDESVERSIRDQIRRMVGDVPVTIHRRGDLKKTRSGKLLPVVSRVPWRPRHERISP